MTPNTTFSVSTTPHTAITSYTSTFSLFHVATSLQDAVTVAETVTAISLEAFTTTVTVTVTRERSTILITISSTATEIIPKAVLTTPGITCENEIECSTTRIPRRESSIGAVDTNTPGTQTTVMTPGKLTTIPSCN
ncbi:hypothetical protein TWF132_011138 [Orbilia oligospora]|nr:hypothetical protein TWF132_011138 [Orbilia oligospora]